MLQRFWIVQGGKPKAVEGYISGEYAEIPLPLGGARRFKWPKWYPTYEDAEKVVQKSLERRLERARKLLEESA